jgi:hypothetical protein
MTRTWTFSDQSRGSVRFADHRQARSAPAEIEPAIETALARVARELTEIAKALERLETLVAFIASGGGSKMNQSQIIAAFVRGACWQLARRSPTWLLLAIVVGAFLFASHH